MSKRTRLTRQEKEKIANRINYFRTIPSSIRKVAANLESGSKALVDNFVDHEVKSVLVGGRVMILNCS